MSRIQRLGIGNGGIDCQISYMQGKKYPNAGEIVKPVQGVTNKTLLKNPYNTLNEPIAKPGKRPLRITTDNRGNVFAKSETMLVPGVTNNNLLKNPYNILETPIPEKRTLTLQRIRDINNKNLPGYITENKGINEIMLQIVSMILDKPVKLITIHLLKILITNNAKEHGYQTQQNILKALSAFDQTMTIARKIFKENTLSPLNIPDQLRPYIDQYESSIRNIYGNMSGKFANIDMDIQTGLTELGLLSNGLTRMFEYNNSIDPSNTLSISQIQNAAFSSPMIPQQRIEAADAAPPVSAAQQQDKQDEAKDVDEQQAISRIEPTQFVPQSIPSEPPAPAIIPAPQGYSSFGINRFNPLLRPAVLLQSQAAAAASAVIGGVANALAPPPPIPGQQPPAFAPFSFQPLNPILQPVILLQAQAAEAAKRATKILSNTVNEYSIQDQQKQRQQIVQQVNTLRQTAAIRQASALDLPVQSPGVAPSPAADVLASQAQAVIEQKAAEAAKLERIRQRNEAQAAPPRVEAPNERQALIKKYGAVRVDDARNIIRFRGDDADMITKSIITSFLRENGIERPPTSTTLPYRLVYTLVSVSAKTNIPINEIMDTLVYNAMYENASKGYAD